MSDLIGSDGPLSPESEATLRALAGTLIPASEAHGVPGADDPTIFADLLVSAGSSLAFLDDGLRALETEAAAEGFAAADADRRLTLAEAFRVSHPEVAGLVISLVCQCYYRDPRVLTSLGIEPRAPFPVGYQVPQGDWSLLDPVRERGPIWRET